MPETWTSGEICRRYNITRVGLQKWQQDPDFPRAQEPDRMVYDYRVRQVWDAEQVRQWKLRKNERRHHRRRRALEAYRRRAGEYGHLTAVAHAYDVHVNTLRLWVKAAGLPLPLPERPAPPPAQQPTLRP